MSFSPPSSFLRSAFSFIEPLCRMSVERVHMSVERVHMSVERLCVVCRLNVYIPVERVHMSVERIRM